MAKLALIFDIIAKDKASKELNNVGDAAEGAGRKGEAFKKGLAIAAKAAVAVGAASAVAGVKLFNHGAALEAMGNKANTVFGDQIGVVEKWAKANAAGMGLSSREATGLAASFGDLLIPMGFTRDQAAKMSTDVVGLSGALSQWSGGQTSAAEAADILAKAMLGERDGLKSLGISISEADVQARLLKNGTDKLTGAALEQAKATATQQLIFEKSTDAQAAYKEGGNKLLTAQNTLKAKFKEVFDELSIRLIPVFTRLSTWVVERGIPAANDLYAQFNRNVLPILKDVASFVSGSVIPTLKVFGEWLGRNKEAVAALAVAVGALFVVVKLHTAYLAVQAVGGLAAYLLQTKLVTAATKAWAAVQWLLNAAMSANPIGIVIAAVAGLTAGVVIAYKRSETFRDIVDRLWASLKTAGGWAVDLGRKVAVEIVGRFASAKAKLDPFLRALQNFELPGWVTTLGSILGNVGKGLKAGFDALKGGVGDGPGRAVGGGGNTLRRVQSMLPAGAYVTSTYRTPAHNARIGGSPTSYHLDRNNPAVDIGGSMGVLDRLYAQLRAAGGWRELLWRTKGHFDHIHVAHSGGTVDQSWARMPGDRHDERTARLQIGEEVIPAGGGSLLVEMQRNTAAVNALRSDLQRLPRDYQLGMRAGAVR